MRYSGLLAGNARVPPRRLSRSLRKCCELAPHIPEDCMDCVSGRSLLESSTAEMAVIGRRRLCTMPRSGINRLVYI
jgi:hypothetical protein